MGQLEDMQAFVRVVEAGGITHAADQLGVAKSAVSRRLSELEARLGSTLLKRTTRRSSLTDAGQRYYERSLKIIDEIAELNATTTGNDDTLAGTLRLAAPLSFGLSHLAPAIDIFMRKYPDLSIRINFSDRQIDLVQEGVDLAFRIADLKDSSLRTRKITPIRLMLCASPDYLKRQGSPRTPEDLKKHRLLSYDSSGSILPWRLMDREGREHIVHPEAKIIANNGEFLRDMGIADHGIFISPTFISWEALAKGDLLQVLPDYRIPSINASAVYPRTRYLPQRARLLIDFLVSRFGETPYWDQYI
jgi:DNA-binding transcriptional LysR family regulator